MSVEWFKAFSPVTEKNVNLPWGGGANGKWFRCYFCGHRFVIGDKFRSIFTNAKDEHNTPGGNPLTCEKCFADFDGVDGLKAEWRRMHDVLKAKFWWANREARG
jgi:hypothetical protein